jgi:hypothetical protein
MRRVPRNVGCSDPAQPFAAGSEKIALREKHSTIHFHSVVCIAHQSLLFLCSLCQPESQKRTFQMMYKRRLVIRAAALAMPAQR